MTTRYRLIISFTLIFSLAAAIVFAQAPPTSKPESKEANPVDKYRGGKIEFDQDEWDFGYAPGNAMVKHTFLIKNTGTETLKITKVKPSCGCTSAPLAKDVLEPGESTELEVGFKTLKFKGEVSKKITITSSDPVDSMVTISFKANVSRPHPSVKVEPDLFDFVQIYEGERAKLTTVLTNISDSKLSLSTVDVPRVDYIDFKLQKDVLNPGQSCKLEVQVKKNAPTGILREAITFDVGDSGQRRLSVPIRGEIISR